MDPLVEKAQRFAQEIEDLVNKTICTDFRLETLQTVPGQVQIVSKPMSEAISLKPVSHPIEFSQLVRGKPVLGIKLGYSVELDSKTKDLRVRTSSAAITLIQEKEKPIIRLEFERDQGLEPGKISARKHSRHAAHVHIHGTSADLSYIWGLHGRHAKRDLESLHIPVGGRRFRPTIEDLIEFLCQEEIINGIKPGGLKALEQGRTRWLAIQLTSTIRGNLPEAIKIIEAEGYTVIRA